MFVVVLLIITAVALQIGTAHITVYSMFGLSVSRSRRRLKPTNSEVITTYDEFGDLPQIKNAYKAIANAKTVGIVRTNNTTIVGVEYEDLRNALQYPLGCNAMHVLEDPRHSLLLTGVVGDCRKVLKHVQQVIVNHTIDYGASPSGHYLARMVGEFMARSTMSSTRPLACHIFIISIGNTVNGFHVERNHGPTECYETTIYEINVAGATARVYAGTAGGNNMQNNILKLCNEYRRNMTVQEGRALIGSLINPTDAASLKVLGKNNEANNHTRAPPKLIQFFELADVR